MQIWSQLSPAQQQKLLTRPAQQQAPQIDQRVADILRQVQQQGDQALLELTRQLDGVNLSDLRLSNEALGKLSEQCPMAVQQAIRQAYANIRSFHQAQYPKDIQLDTQPGVHCQQKHAPLASVGLYIPGGSAPLPSTVLMLATPAKVAGCQRTVLCTPPNSQGLIHPAIAFAAVLCEVDEVYLLGGAQAIAALAYGSESIKPVDKIFGPGNAYVTAAKQQVSRSGCAIDMPAGPSEVLVLADSSANPAFVAADLLSQAEHGPDSQCILLSHSQVLIEQSQAAITAQLTQLSRQDIASAALKHARFILTDNLTQSIEVSNRYAPEHLIVNCQQSDTLLPKLTNAGSIFVGPYSPESAGDYASGTNHVLPTYGYARNYSSLGLLDFMRRYTVQRISQQGLQILASSIVPLAEAEGLDAHARAVTIRLEASNVSE